MGAHEPRDRSGGAHGGHVHGAGAGEGDRQKLIAVLALIVGFMLVEVIAGAIVHSLALLSDAAHMLADAGAIAASLFAIGLAARPARGAMTYGLRRAEILSAQFNGATLLVLALLITYEGIRRLIVPARVGGATVTAVALAGIAVNLAATAILARANRASMNIEGAFQHILTDLAAFVFTAIAGLAIITTGFMRADGLASLLIAAIMLRAAYGLLRDSALSAHVLVGRETDCHAVRRELEALLLQRFALEHTTLQVEHEPDELIAIEPTEPLPRPAHGRL